MDRQKVLDWVKQQYGTEPDYPWQDANTVLRHRESRKWYGLIMEVGRDKLGMEGEGGIDIINLKCDPLLIGSLRTQEGFHPAYHMNKENWISIRLDGSVADEQIQNLIGMSYQLTRTGKKQKA